MSTILSLATHRAMTAEQHLARLADADAANLARLVLTLRRLRRTARRPVLHLLHPPVASASLV